MGVEVVVKLRIDIFGVRWRWRRFHMTSNNLFSIFIRERITAEPRDTNLIGSGVEFLSQKFVLQYKFSYKK